MGAAFKVNIEGDQGITQAKGGAGPLRACRRLGKEAFIDHFQPAKRLHLRVNGPEKSQHETQINIAQKQAVALAAQLDCALAIDDPKVLRAVMIDEERPATGQPRKVEQALKAAIPKARFNRADIHSGHPMIGLFGPEDRGIETAASGADEEGKTKTRRIRFGPRELKDFHAAGSARSRQSAVAMIGMRVCIIGPAAGEFPGPAAQRHVLEIGVVVCIQTLKILGPSSIFKSKMRANTRARRGAVGMKANTKTAPKVISGAAHWRWIGPLIPRVPEDHVTALFAFHGGEVRVNLARADLRVCERDRDIFAA